MPWGAVATAVVGGAVSAYTGNKAADAASDAANVSAEANEASLAYQQQVEALPLAYRDAAMQGLGSQYGFTQDANGNVTSDGSTIDERTLSSPLYTGMLQQGESAIGRNASATGRLRGGSTAADLGSNAQNAYMTAYNQQLDGLSAFSGANLNTNAIANTMANTGTINANGITAAAAADQQRNENIFNSIGSGLSAYGSTI